MNTFGLNNYALKFSENYLKLYVENLASGQIVEEFDLSQQVAVKVEGLDYVVEEGKSILPAVEKVFLPLQASQEFQPVLRFQDLDWIGSEDLRDTRVGSLDYHYHLEKCEITLQSIEEAEVKVVVRSRCKNEQCIGHDEVCRTVREVEPQA